MYSEKATKFCKISNKDLTGSLALHSLDKSTVEISQNIVAFSEYMNFKGWLSKCLDVICQKFNEKAITFF